MDAGARLSRRPRPRRSCSDANRSASLNRWEGRSESIDQSSLRIEDDDEYQDDCLPTKPTSTTKKSGLILALLMNALISSADVVDKVLDGERINKEEALELYGLPIEELGALADHRRKLAKGPAYCGRGRESTPTNF